jgi:SAM-dependent methyltransferase
MLRLEEHRTAWDRKPAVRLLYRDFYERIGRCCNAGRSLEIGSGAGHAQSVIPDLVRLDVQHTPWVDIVADAHCLPFQDGSFDNIILLDVLHHLQWPLRFFDETQRVLRPGGRIVMLEPGISPISRIFYGLFHEEPVDMGADPFSDEPMAGPDPAEANQAVPELIFCRGAERFAERFDRLKILSVSRLSLWAYPMSGGFKDWSALPAAITLPLLRLEDAVMPAVGRVMAFRLLIVLEYGG